MERYTIYKGLSLFKSMSLLFVFAFFYLGVFLDITKVPHKSDIIVSLGGSDISRINTSIELLEEHYSVKNQIFYFGTKKQCYNVIHSIKCIEGMKNTMDELNYIDTVVKDKEYSSIIIVTSPPHSKRVHIMIENFTKNLKNKYVIVSSHPNWWHKYYYFLNIRALVYSFLEVSKIIYNDMKYTFLKDTVVSQKLDYISNKIKIYIYNEFKI